MMWSTVHAFDASMRPAWHRFRQRRLALLGLLLFGCLVLLVGIVAPLMPHPPTEVNLAQRLLPPGHGALLGTDELGRDLLRRLLWGGRLSLGIALAGVGLGLAAGGAVGLIAGQAGGWLDGLLMRLLDLWLALPDLLLFLLVVTLLGPGSVTLMLGVALTSFPGVARLVRAATLSSQQVDYLLAARMVGVPPGQLLLRHLLPNIGGLLLVYATSIVGSALWAVTGLSFLGLGAAPPTPEWGAMLHGGLPLLRTAPWVAALPGLTISLTVLAVNLIGDGLRDALDPHVGPRRV